MKIINTEWTLEDALIFIRLHQPIVHTFNYHLALAGSVLNDGRSNNDLDIICMKMYNDETTKEEELMKYIDTWGKVIDKSEGYKLETGRELFGIILNHTQRQIDLFLY